MRVPVYCIQCCYRFHLATASLALLRMCPACDAPRTHLVYPARGPKYAPRRKFDPPSPRDIVRHGTSLRYPPTRPR